MRGSHGRRGRHEAAQVTLWSLRAHMAFVVDSLEAFLQTDVVAALYDGVRESLTAASSFDDILAIHERYLAQLVVRTFRRFAVVWKWENKNFGPS